MIWPKSLGNLENFMGIFCFAEVFYCLFCAPFLLLKLQKTKERNILFSSFSCSFWGKTAKMLGWGWRPPPVRRICNCNFFWKMEGFFSKLVLKYHMKIKRLIVVGIPGPPLHVQQWLHVSNVVGWWTKFTKGRKPKAEENPDEEEDVANKKKPPILELTEDEYEAFYSKFPFPWWCIIIAYVLSILSILWWVNTRISW